MSMRLTTIALASLALWSLAPAQAQEETPPDRISPYYRGFSFAGISPDGDFSFLAEHLQDDFYESNVAPRTFVRAAGSLTVEGSTLSFDTWAASTGFYAARSYATMTVQNANPAHVYYAVSGHGSTTSVQFFSPEAAASRAVFTWNVSGSSTDSARPSRWADGRVDFFATTEEGRSWTELFTGGFSPTLFEYGPGSYSYTLPNVPLGTPIYLHFWTSAFAQIEANTLAAGSTATLTANFANTVVLAEVQLFDADDNPIGSWTMQDTQTSEDLFDQTGRLVNIDPPPPIPEPATWALWLAGLAGLARLTRRRATASAS